MVRDISTSSTLSGANMTLVLLSVVGVVVLCNVGYTFRWVEWCNMTDAPYVDAVKNIASITAGAMVTALIAKDMVPVRRLWAVVVVYAVFYAVLPTSMFFKDYLYASFLMCVVVYAVWHLGGRNDAVYLFLSSFVVGVAMWWTPAVVMYMLFIYAGVFILSPQDTRNWLMPIVGLISVCVMGITYASMIEGRIVLPSCYDIEGIFSMPYTEKVFAGLNMYFYVGVLALFTAISYLRYVSEASRGTQQEKKQAMIITALMLVCVVMALCVPSARYMVVFSSLPFALVVGRHITSETLSRWWRTIYMWALAIVAVMSMWTFE